MLGVVFLVALLAALIVASAWLSLRGLVNESADSVRTVDEAATTAPRPRTLEGVLAGQLIDHQITRRQYRRAMHGLAERDAERHPLPDLPEIPPGGATT
ncbi:hypothetical protein [Actinoplanes sp. NPDC049681]|uniref:hypothetical protein n=1 Tax=Actinoplanes sp. NPDC049681 TaxID=3363905 RepID=UPI0037A29A81